MAAKNAARRMRRSTRVTGALLLFGLATLVVVGAVLSSSALVGSIAALVAILCGWASLRLMWLA